MCFYLFPSFAVIVKGNRNKTRTAGGWDTGVLPGFWMQERVILGVASSFLAPLELA